MLLNHSGPGGTLCVHTTVGWYSTCTVLLRVLGPASGVCYSTYPEFPELCTGTPVFDWAGMAACGSSLHLSFVMLAYMCVCVCVCVCVWCGFVSYVPLVPPQVAKVVDENGVVEFSAIRKV